MLTLRAVPDFRSAGGLFRSLKEEYNLKGSGKNLFDASVYRDDNSTSSFHDMVSTMSKLTKEAKPTAFHHMLATIAQEDRLLRLYSQNVDGIDTSLEPLKTCTPLAKEDGKWPRTVQLHGGLEKMVCSKCHELSDLDPELFDGPIAPLCPRCEEINDIRTNHEGKRSHGIGRLRPRMVLYNEHNPDDEAIGTVTKEDLRKRPDAVIVVGTTLKVPGVRRIVREMCATVRDRRGGVTIWINNDPPPVSKDLEDCWDIVVKGTSDEVAKHAAMRQWNDPVISETYTDLSDESARKVTEQALHVRLPSKSPSHAALESLPSTRHLNNSFKPPLETDTPPRKLVERPIDWSPIVTPRHSVISSIEDESFATDDSIAVTHTDTVQVATGLLTPSKSQRNSPTKKVQPVSINDRLKNPAKSKPVATKGKGTKKAVPAKTKKSNVKYVKPALSQTKPRAKPKASAKAQKAPAAKPLTNAFKSSKSAATAARSAKSDPQSPSKLRQVSNMSSSSPMEALSPQDSRNNTSPATSLESSHSHEAFVSGKPIAGPGRKRMRLEVEDLVGVEV